MFLLRHSKRLLSKRKQNVEKYNVTPPLQTTLKTSPPPPIWPKKDYSHLYAFGGLCAVYLGSLVLYATRNDDNLDDAMSVLLDDEQDIKQSTLEGHYRHFALLSENEFNWVQLDRYLDGFIFLFQNEQNYQNRCWMALCLSNMIQKKKNFDKISQRIPMEDILKLMSTVQDNSDLLKRAMKFGIQYLNAQKKYTPEVSTAGIEELVMKSGTSESSEVRSATSRFYPMMTLTPTFKAYLEKLTAVDIPDIEIRLNVNKALGATWSWHRLTRAMWDPFWGRMALYVLGGGATTTLGYHYFVYRVLPDSIRWPKSTKRGLMAMPIMLGAFIIDALGSKADKYVFSNYDLGNTETTAYAAGKYFIQLSFLGWGCTVVKYLVPSYFLTQLSQYPSTPNDTISRDGYAYEKSLSKWNQ
jgi:hypothetical protein